MADKSKKTDALIPAATVLLLREGSNGMEVFMVVRHHQIDFASGALVFPGGKIDPADMVAALAPFCRGADALDDTQRSLRIGAIREAFEESGVLLATPQGEGAFVSPERLRALAPWRERLHKNDATMLEFVQTEQLVLTLDVLAPFAHWITPEFMPKRFDTHFYTARVPEAHQAVHDGSESVDSVWIAPSQAVADGEAGKRVVIFPTRMNLQKLAAYDTIAGALAPGPVATVTPWLESQGEDTILKIAPDAGYGDVFEVMPKRQKS